MRTRLVTTPLLVTLVIVVALAGAGRAQAQAPAQAPATAPAPAAAPTRSADAILDDFAAAVASKRALARHKSLYMKRSVNVKGMGVEGTEERWANAAGKFVMQMSLPGIGTMKSGSTGPGPGGVRWSEDPINGLRVLKGPEEEQASLETRWNAELELKKLFKTRAVQPPPAGAPKGASLECVLLTPAHSAPMTMCFDTATHLRVYQEGRQQSPQGEVPYAVRLSDWREVEGVKVPHLEEMTAGPMTMELKVQEVKFGTKIAPARFKMPRPAKP
jgi:hypothetical protein